MNPLKFRKRPIVVEAMQYTLFSGHEVAQWASGQILYSLAIATLDNPSGEYLAIRTLEGMVTAIPGDWVVKGVRGEVYPCNQDIFQATYEPA